MKIKKTLREEKMVKGRIDGKDFEYSDEDLSNMSIEQLKQLKC